MAKDFSLPFIKKQLLASNTYAFFFDRSYEPFDFLPGQFVRVTLQIEHPDLRGTSRYFSISSSPTDKNNLRIITKVLQSTFKKALLVLLPRQQVKFFGPNGQFYFRQDQILQHIFLAGGIGITPFLSILSYIDATKIVAPITLFGSFSTPEEAILYEETMAIAQRNPSVKVVYTITRPQDSKAPWNGEVGRISEELIKKYAPNITESLFYLVGPAAMLSAMEELVKTMNIPTERVFKERFVGY